jgi:hypothetical protein
MPTESSVVASLIRDLNTRRLPSEPADAFLFQQTPAQQAKQTARAIKAPEIGTKSPASVTVRVASPNPATSRSAVKGWLQFVFATALCGGWAYVAFQLDADEESSTPAALVLPSAPITTAPLPAPSIQPAQATAASASPATALAPAEPAAQAPIVEPIPDPQPTVAEPATAPAPAPSHAPKKHHRHVSKPKANVAQAKAMSEPSDSASSTAAPAAMPASPPPAKLVTTPSKPAQQSDDSEDPLK